MLKLGLVGYVADSPLASRLKVTFDPPPNQQQATAASDPWNFWVFRIGASGEVEAEEQNNQRDLSASFSANRTTDRWKFDLNGTLNYEREQFELEEEETFTAISRDSQVVGLLVKSLTEHWSAGGTAAIGTSTFENYDLRSRIGPGIEFNVFPYRESTRRILTMFYSLGLRTANYTEETIFGKFSERLLDHQLEASIALRQPWGTASGSLEMVHYLNRTDKYRLEGFGEIDVRLFKGFSLELFARGSRRRDQLSLRRGSATARRDPRPPARAGYRLRIRNWFRLQLLLRIHLQQHRQSAVQERRQFLIGSFLPFFTARSATPRLVPLLRQLGRPCARRRVARAAGALPSFFLLLLLPFFGPKSRLRILHRPSLPAGRNLLIDLQNSSLIPAFRR